MTQEDFCTKCGEQRSTRLLDGFKSITVVEIAPCKCGHKERK